MATFHIWTLGCQMNQADSLKLAAGLEKMGYRAVEDDADADLVVINTCSVRQHAEDRAYSRMGVLNKRRREGQRVSIAVMGCMALRTGVWRGSSVVMTAGTPNPSTGGLTTLSSI